MMSFDEFKDKIVEGIRDFLPDSFKEAEISLNDVTKNNDTRLTGLTIRNNASEISPTIYLEQFYDKYKDGFSLDELLENIANIRVDRGIDTALSENFSVDMLTKLEMIKDKITCKLLNREMNEDYLSNKPFTAVEDLAVVYMVDLGGGPNGHMSTVITDNLMEMYGLTTPELHSIAMDNLAKTEISFRSMMDVIREMMPENEPDFFGADEMPMYVLNTKDMFNGARAILDTRTMDDIAQKLNGDFIVIPSSINECIIFPMKDALNREDMDGMIQDVNSTQVEAEERLSDHIYMYDAVEHELVHPDRYVERVYDREHDKTTDSRDVKDTVNGRENRESCDKRIDKSQDRDRVSVKDKIAAKTVEVAAKAKEHPVPEKAVEAVSV